jgi:hypothetical protein
MIGQKTKEAVDALYRVVDEACQPLPSIRPYRILPVDGEAVFVDEADFFATFTVTHPSGPRTEVRPCAAEWRIEGKGLHRRAVTTVDLGRMKHDVALDRLVGGCRGGDRLDCRRIRERETTP